jgi:hypothetical protein
MIRIVVTRTTETIMAAKEIIVKKYVVRLNGDEREQLAALTRKGRGPARRLMKARILLKADASETGEGWSDNQIIEALETSASMVYRVAIPPPFVFEGAVIQQATEDDILRITATLDAKGDWFRGIAAANHPRVEWRPILDYPNDALAREA